MTPPHSNPKALPDPGGAFLLRRYPAPKPEKPHFRPETGEEMGFCAVLGELRANCPPPRPKRHRTLLVRCSIR